MGKSKIELVEFAPRKPMTSQQVKEAWKVLNDPNLFKDDQRVLNRDVRRLYRDYNQWKKEDIFNEVRENILKQEFQRLYDLDKTMVLFNRKSVLRMLKMNLTLAQVPVHRFGSEILI